MLPAWTVKVAVDVPDATVTEPGRVRRLAGLAATVRRVPPPGAGWVTVAVQTVEPEDGRVVLVQVRLEMVVVTTTDSVTELVDGPIDAVTVAVLFDVTDDTAATKLAVVAAAGTVMEGGTATVAGALVDRETLVPPLGAALDRVTVQVVEEEAGRLVLAQVSEVRVGAVAVTVTVASWVVPLSDAVIVAVWFEETACAVVVKVAVVDDAGTVIDTGTVRVEVALLESATLVPPLGAALDRVTVQVVEEEAARLVLAQLREVKVTAAAVTVIVTGWLVPLSAAVTIAVWLEETAAAVTVKLAAVADAGTVTEAGTVRVEVALLESVTLMPPLGAALDRITTQVVEEEAARLVLAQVSEDKVTAPAGDTVIVTAPLVPLSVAVIVAVWFEETALAVAVKVAVVADAGTVTEAGTVRVEVALLESATLAPPLGAAFDRVTVQVVEEEAGRLVLAQLSEVRVTAAAGDTVIVTVRLVPLSVAVTIAVWLVMTDNAVAVKVAVVADAGTVIEAGTVNAVIALLESATLAPPAGAALDSVTVQAVDNREPRLMLEQLSELRVTCTTSDRLAVRLTPFRVAVAVAV